MNSIIKTSRRFLSFIVIYFIVLNLIYSNTYSHVHNTPLIEIGFPIDVTLNNTDTNSISYFFLPKGYSDENKKYKYNDLETLFESMSGFQVDLSNGVELSTQFSMPISMESLLKIKSLGIKHKIPLFFFDSSLGDFGKNTKWLVPKELGPDTELLFHGHYLNINRRISGDIKFYTEINSEDEFWDIANSLSAPFRPLQTSIQFDFDKTIVILLMSDRETWNDLFQTTKITYGNDQLTISYTSYEERKQCNIIGSRKSYAHQLLVIERPLVWPVTVNFNKNLIPIEVPCE